MPAWLWFLLFGFGGLVLPLMGLQFRLLLLFGPLTPILSVVLMIVGGVLFVRDRSQSEEEDAEDSESLAAELEASRSLRKLDRRETE